MTQQQLREKVVRQAVSWLGCRESDGSHKKIIDLYNSHTPLARGYRLQYTDPWCAGMVSAVAIACGLTGIMPTEVSCSRLIALYKNLGRWQEQENMVPSPGDLIIYDWEDTGSGDNTGDPDHIGIVEKVSGGTITVIEGNYDNAVKRRDLAVNGRYIRGYCLPDYGALADNAEDILPLLRLGVEGGVVKALQILLEGYGFSCGRWGIDGELGADTQKAMKAFQASRGLMADGICGNQTWGALLGVNL